VGNETPQTNLTGETMQIDQQSLIQAASRYANRQDTFANGKAQICLNLATTLDQFGGFKSEKQANFASNLIKWSIPQQAQVVRPIALPTLYALVKNQNLTLHLGECKLVLFGSGVVGVVNPVFGMGTYGVINANGILSKLAKCPDSVVAILKDVELRGLDAVKEIGRATGRCSVCSRTLTDPKSIELGIGSTCIKRFANYRDSSLLVSKRIEIVTTQ
jgi:Family of unknown function (DUF6011)